MEGQQLKLYNVNFSASIRDFSTQSSGDFINSIIVSGNNLDEWKSNLFEVIKGYLHRKIIFIDNNSPFWDEVETPNEEQLSEFVSFKDLASKSIFFLNAIDSEKLNGMKNKPAHSFLLMVHKYSLTVKSAPLFKVVNEKLLKPFERDRSQAVSHEAAKSLAEELKVIHRYRYVSDDCNYFTWAVHIIAQPAHLREQLMNSGPPRYLHDVFSYVPTSSDNILNNARRNAGVAGTINRDYDRKIQEISHLFDRLRTLDAERASLSDAIQGKFEALKEYGNNNNSMLQGLQNELHPEENELSEQALARITEQLDIDHI